MKMLTTVTRAMAPTLYYLAKAYWLEQKHGTLPKAKRDAFIQAWGLETLLNLNVEITAEGRPDVSQPSILVGNHIGYLDIPLLCSQAPVLFLAKAELARWPLIGRACKLVDLVFVQRESMRSRQESIKAIVHKLQKMQENIVIFPSGTTSIDEEKKWQRGAFRIAKEHGIPVQPFRIHYNPLRPAAYIDDDSFIGQLHQLTKHKKIQASISFHPPLQIADIATDMENVRRWCIKPSQLPRQP